MKYAMCVLLACLPVLLLAQTPDSTVVAPEIDSLLAKANELWRAKNDTDALQLAQRAADIAKEKWGEDNASYAASLDQMAKINTSLRRIEDALELSMKVLELRTNVLGRDHPDYVSSLINLGYLYWVKGDYFKAEPLYSEANFIRERTLGREHPDYIKTLESFASISFYSGYYEKAVQLYLDVLNIREKTQGKQNPEYAATLNTLATLYNIKGNYEKAEPLQLEALKIRESTLGKEHPAYATSMDNLASLYLNKGDYIKAEPLYLAAKAIREKVLGKQSIGYAASLNNLSVLYSKKSEYSKAEPLLWEAMEIREKNYGKEHPEYARGLHNLAIFYSDMKAYAKAEPLFLEVISIQESILGKEHRDFLISLGDLGALYYHTKDYLKAELFISEAKEIQRKILGKEHPDYTKSLNNLALVYQVTNRIHESANLILELEELERRSIERAAVYSSESQMAAFLNTFTNSTSHFYSFTQKYNSLELSRTGFNNVLFLKGLVLENAQRLSLAVTESDSLARETFRRWQGCRRRLANEYAKPIADRRYISEVEAEAEGYEKSLIRNLPAFNEMRHIPRWQEVRDRLQPGEVVVEFIHYRYFTPNPTDSTMYAALVLLPGDAAPSFLPLFEEKQLQRLLYRPGLSEEIIVKDLYGNSLDLLRLLWQPLEPFLRDAETVYYSPSGLLHRLNPAALLDESGTSVSKGRRWVRFISSRELVSGRLADQSFAQSSPAGRMAANRAVDPLPSAVILGGITYEMDSLAFVAANPFPLADNTPALAPKDGDFRYIATEQTYGTRGGAEEEWRPLPNSGIEADEVSALLRKAGFSSEVLKGYYASEEQLKQIGTRGNSPRILHIATHGFAFPDPAKEPSRGFRDFEPNYKLLEDPMLRTGLLLAGSNYYWKNKRPLTNREDGVLVAFEVRDLNLQNTELVVLSACQTGLGDIVNTEGVYGLQRAFRIAGAKFLIVSLWRVPDKQTQELMQLFYENWAKKQESLRDAFANAQEAMQKKYPNPFLWAGFVLVE